MLLSIETPINFIRSWLEFGQVMKKDLDKIGRIEMPNEVEGWKRARLYTFYAQALDIFDNRANFVLDALDKKMDRLDVMDQILRGMLELYCRFLYIAKANEISRFRSIIWLDISTYCQLPLEIVPNSSILKGDYTILESLGDDASACEIAVIKREILLSLKEMKETKKLKQLREKMGFPGIRKILINYYDESCEPRVSKNDFYRLYARFSEQIHGNPYYEIPKAPADTAIYRIMAATIIICAKFYRELASIARREKECDTLLRELSECKPDFTRLWDLSK